MGQGNGFWDLLFILKPDKVCLCECVLESETRGEMFIWASFQENAFDLSAQPTSWHLPKFQRDKAIVFQVQICAAIQVREGLIKTCAIIKNGSQSDVCGGAESDRE